MLIGIDASRATLTERTGTEAYSLHLIRALLKQPTAHRFRLYLNQAAAPDLFAPQSNLELRSIPFPRLWTHLRLAVELFQHWPDLLFVPAHSLPLLFPGRAAVTVHDLGYLQFPEAHPAAGRRYLRWSTRWSARRATVVIADSEATRRDLVAHDHIDPAKIVVVYPGYDESLRPVRDAATLAAVRQRYGIEGDYLMTLGTLQPRKNLLRLIDAWVELGRPLPLVLAGKLGWLSEPIVTRAREAGVCLPGFVADEDKAALLSGARAFLFPSLYEGFGFPVLEAMACGVPVLCSNTSSLPEVAGDAALLVDPLDTQAIAAGIGQLLNDEPLRQELVQRGFENLQRFSWEQCAREVLQALEAAG